MPGATSVSLQASTFSPADHCQDHLEGRHFDFIIAHDLLDKRNAAWLLEQVLALLAPGGRFLFYETNPWNVIRRLRQGFRLPFGYRDPRGGRALLELAPVPSWHELQFRG